MRLAWRAERAPEHNKLLPSMRNRSTALCIAGAFCAALALAAAVLAALGAGERGTHVALQATARLSFVLFWPAYAAAALAALFGPRFSPCGGVYANLVLPLRPHTSCTWGWSPDSATSAMRRRAARSFSWASPRFARICLRCSRWVACSGRSGPAAGGCCGPSA